MSPQDLVFAASVVSIALVLSLSTYFWLSYKARKAESVQERIRVWRFQSVLSVVIAALLVFVGFLMSLDVTTAPTLKLVILCGIITFGAAIPLMNEWLIRVLSARNRL